MIIKRSSPQNINPEHSAFFEPISTIELPKPSFKLHRWVVLFKNGIVVNISGVKKQSLLYNTRLKEVGGYILIIKMLLIELYRGRFKFIKNGEITLITVINEWSNNYFHWFTEVMPKIYFIKSYIPNFSVLIPSNYTSEYQVASLKLLNVSYVYFEGIAFVKKLYLPSRHAPYSAHYNPIIINALSREIKKNTHLSFHLGRLIYITRRKAKIRRITNEDKVIDLLTSYGFGIVEFESFSFEQQVSIAYNADIIIGIHGAGLTNLMFCKEATTVLELSLENQILDKCYYTLADACGLKYYYQFCKSADDLNDYYYLADLVVDLELLRQNLALIGLQKKC